MFQSLAKGPIHSKRGSNHYSCVRVSHQSHHTNTNFFLSHQFTYQNPKKSQKNQRTLRTFNQKFQQHFHKNNNDFTSISYTFSESFHKPFTVSFFDLTRTQPQFSISFHKLAGFGSQILTTTHKHTKVFTRITDFSRKNKGSPNRTHNYLDLYKRPNRNNNNNNFPHTSSRSETVRKR